MASTASNNNAAINNPVSSNTWQTQTKKNRQYRKGKGDTAKEEKAPRPTHFISLPIGHHDILRTSVKAFHDDLLLPTNVHVDGIDKSILIDPRRLHLTLGVMHLEPDRHDTDSKSQNSRRTVQSALSLLQSLAPRVKEILNGNRLEVHLSRMDVMNVRHNEASVLWLGPDISSEGGRRLKSLCDVIHEEFRRTRYITETRPLKLHCTVVNASHRKPRPKKFTSFSYTQLMDSTAVRNVTIREGKPLVVNFGTYTIDEIQLCEMGSHGPENEYVSCGGISLTA